MTTGRIRILTISIACVLCACFVDSASAQPQAPQTTYIYCYSHQPERAPVNMYKMYYSEVFVVDYSVGEARVWYLAGEMERRTSHGAVPPAPWVEQFDQFIFQTYSNSSKRGASCSQFGTLAEAQKRLDSEIQFQQFYKAIRTGWKYTPNPNATPPAIGTAAGQASTAAASATTAASGTAATQGKIYFCENTVVLDQQNRQYKEYWSDVFASDAEQTDISNAWRVYLATTYQLGDSQHLNGCGYGAPGDGDRAIVQIRELNASRKQQWERRRKILQDRVAAGSPGIVEQHTVVDTGWKYTGQAVAAAPAPATPPCSNKPAGGNLPCGVPATAPARATAQAPSASRPVDPCAFTGVGMATHPPAGCGPVITSYAVCYSANNQSTVYLSSAFAVTAMDNPSWINGFTQFLAQKYSYQGGGVGCNNMTLNIATTSLKNRIAALRANKKQVVETGWTFNSVPALAVEPVPAPVSAAPSAAPVVPAAPATLYAVCWDATLGMRDLTAYFGVPFAVSAHNDQVWATAFKSYLNDKYGSTSAGNVACNVSQSLAQAQQNAQQWKDRYSAHRKIIETGWKYQ